MEETVAVARAYGIELDEGTAKGYSQMLSATPVTATCSTMRDVVDGKPSETDGLSGAVIRMGQAATPPVPTPSHAIVCALLMPGEKKARGELTY